jgi:ABC-type branched-subunit amino acid transport system ATPase component
VSPLGALVAEGITARFGGVTALAGVSVVLQPGEVVGLIGPNGSGKSTMLNVLSGFVRPATGQVVLDGTDVTRWPTRRLSRAGVARTFQDVRVFRDLTVAENILAGALGAGLARRPAQQRSVELVEAFDLIEWVDTFARSLPYGIQRRLAFARALAPKPTLLLLDEPAAGLDVGETLELIGLIGQIHASSNLGMMIIEHDMEVIHGLCERVYVLDSGKIIAQGTPTAIAQDELVIEAYLGTEEDQ